MATLYDRAKALTILRDRSPAADPHALALAALGWVLADEDRAARLMALTGITPEALRDALGSADQAEALAAVLDYLMAHEPDLLAAAAALRIDPAALVAAHHALTGGFEA